MMAMSQRLIGERGWRSLACAALTLASLLAACNIDSAQVGSPSVTQPPIAATATAAAPTATLPAPGGLAYLGATAQEFIARYGPPTGQSDPAGGEIHFHQYLGVPTNYLVIQEGKYLGVTPGDANVLRVVVAAPPAQAWSVNAGKLTCTGFSPPDAQPLRHVTTSSSGAVVGWDDIYQSDKLASVFPASAFEDASQKPAPPGSFDISYIYASSGDTGHVTSCTLALGERQTVG